ncbi:MAG: hypothetical protein AB1758_27490, partial [Candidatus Eremiobacterota bacterium]
ALGLPEGVDYRLHQMVRNDRGETFLHLNDGQALTDPSARNHLLLGFDREGRLMHAQDSVAAPPPPMPVFPPWPPPLGPQGVVR